MRRQIFYKTLFVVAFLLGPKFVGAEIMITEVAWMGTAVSANDEWLELYNDGASPVNLTGWTITSLDGTPNINLSGTLPAGAYGLVERTDDTTYPGITAVHIFTGAFGNEGENLSLKNGGVVVQSLSFSGGWPAGDVATKHTMQWNGATWITGPESAGGPTIATGGGDDDDDTSGDDDTDDDTTGDDDTADDDSAGDDDEEEDSGTSTSTNSSAKAGPVRKVYDDMIFELDFPKRAIAGSPVHFKAQALDFDRTPMFQGTYMFNMGDGTVRTYTRGFNKDEEGFFHTYEYPGSYSIKIKYYRTYFDGVDPEVDDTFIIEVGAPTVSITTVHPDGGIEMKNSSANEIDISGWKLKDATGKSFDIPEDTVVLPGKSITLGTKRTKLSPQGGVSLLTPTGVLAVAWSPVAVKVQRVASASAKKEVIAEPVGEVLGTTDALIQTVEAEEPDSIEGQERGQQGLIYTLLFIILALISVIAVMFLQKSEKPVNEYELIDE
jgi:hypothetical protein